MVHMIINLLHFTFSCMRDTEINPRIKPACTIIACVCICISVHTWLVI